MFFFPNLQTTEWVRDGVGTKAEDGSVNCFQSAPGWCIQKHRVDRASDFLPFLNSIRIFINNETFERE